MNAYLDSASRGRGGRIDKRPARSRGNNRHLPAAINRSQEAERHVAKSSGALDVEHPPELPGLNRLGNALRTKASIHACSDLSLEFVTQAGLETDDDTNTIALNLMDYFLFSEANWLPELSYCRLHAACFLMASLVTGKSNTAEDIAGSLGPDSAFVRAMAAPLAEDDDAAAAILEVISVNVEDVKIAYELLHQRREQLAQLMGQYADRIGDLLLPLSSMEKEEPAAVEEEEENFDIFEE